MKPLASTAHIIAAMALVLIAAAGIMPAATLAQPSAEARHGTMTVTPGPALQARAADIGEGEIVWLGDQLRERAERAVGANPHLADANISITILDARPNRPTRAQALRTPSLSVLESIGIGGARLHVLVRWPDGREFSFEAGWETDNLAQVQAGGVWSDALRAFDITARRLRALRP